MKELSIEEKAKAYEEALALMQDCIPDENGLVHIRPEDIFPKLAESKDEKIRKWLICTLKSLNNSPVQIDGAYEMMLPAINWLKKQGEQKPTDNEPKFHKGEWVVYECGEETATLQITRIVGETYVFSDDSTLSVVDEDTLRLWDVTKDAKAGDLLCDYLEEYDNPLIFILKKFERVDFGLVKPSDYSYYCFLTAGDRQIFKEGEYHHKHNIKPATKEQRDILFQKMKEAGYEWDAEKKELKKIEQSLAWSEKDEMMWSSVLQDLQNIKDNNPIVNIAPEFNWLKSLKERYTWKPSDEQIRPLEYAIDYFKKKNNDTTYLESLYQDLKKLEG